jgi:hypothetical protein
MEEATSRLLSQWGYDPAQFFFLAYGGMSTCYTDGTVVVKEHKWLDIAEKEIIALENLYENPHVVNLCAGDFDTGTLLLEKVDDKGFKPVEHLALFKDAVESIASYGDQVSDFVLQEDPFYSNGPGFYEPFHPLIVRFMQDRVMPVDFGPRVLCHGDLWHENIMFDGDKVVFIDPSVQYQPLLVDLSFYVGRIIAYCDYGYEFLELIAREFELDEYDLTTMSFLRIALNASNYARKKEFGKASLNLQAMTRIFRKVIVSDGVGTP